MRHHIKIESLKREKKPINKGFYAATCGSFARSTRLQSIPSNSIESCAALKLTVPWVACGHTKRPCSNRLAKRHNPSPLHHKIFTRSPALPRNTKSCPEKGSSERCVCTSAASPSKPLRRAVAPAASHTFTPEGSAIIAPPEDRSHARALRHPHARAPQCCDRYAAGSR